MNTWTSGIIVAALLSAGCTAKIDAVGSGSGSGSGPGNGPGSASGSGGTSGQVDPNDPAVQADPTICVPGIPQTSQLPRLTGVQFDNTVFDLVGLTGTSSMLAPDTENVDQRAWDGYQVAAQTIAADVMADPTAKAKVVTCTPDGDGSACAGQIITTFGARAFRRPLTDGEIARFTKIYTDRAAITPTGTFDEAVELILRTFMLSPSFLTRAELVETPEAEHIALSPYEVASRLSYMLLDTMPDDTLLTAAASNLLLTPEQIREQAVRLLADPRARAKVGAFHEHYMHMGSGTRWAEFQRDTTKYPSFNESLVALMSQETERFFDHVVFDMAGTFRDLITSPVAFVNAGLAPLYGLDPTGYGADLVPVNLDAATRPGVLTRVGFLASHANFDRPSPILRGAFIQKYVLCTTIDPPPPEAEGTMLPEVSPTASNRERTDAQTSPVACAGCHHSLINPTGFAMEAFDGVGGFQTIEAGTGATVNSTASVIIGDSTVDVAGPAELMEAIAASPEANLCYARNWVQAAYERGLTNEDSCVAEELAGKLTAGGYKVLDLIADLSQADSFRLRAVPEVAP